MFDAQEYLATLEPPVFVAPNGRTYTGRILSHPQWMPLQIYLNTLSNTKELTHKKLYKAARRLTKAMFPKPRWMFWQHSAAYWVNKLPPVGVLNALWSFMEAQAPALGLALPERPGPNLFREEETSIEPPPVI